jgi:hypothetical protein
MPNPIPPNNHQPELFMTDPCYPIGKFSWSGSLAPGMRRAKIQAIADTPAQLRAAVYGLSEHRLDTPYREGGWTVRQVVHHLPDSHLNAYVRFKLALTEDQPLVKTYDEAAWANLADTPSTPVETSLVLLEKLHERWVNLLRAMPDADFLRTFRHPQHNAPLPIDWLVAVYGWHGPHHVAHITELRKKMGW